LDERKFPCWCIGTPTYSAQHAPIGFAPTQALGGTNAQNIENQHFSVNFSRYALFIKFNRFKMTLSYIAINYCS